LQLGIFSVASYAVSNGVATLTFRYDYPPVVTTGEKIVVAGVNNALVDGTWAVKDFNGAVGSGVASVSYQINTNTTSSAMQSPLGGYVNIISKTGDPFDVYVFDKSGKRLAGTAPIACNSL
jgi:hypothetical protein